MSKTFVALIAVFFAAPFTNIFFADEKAQQLILNIPGDIDYPRESLSLSIHLPNKIQPSKATQEITKTRTTRRFDFNSNPIEEISPKSRFRPIMANYARKGLFRSQNDARIAQNRYTLKEQAARIVITIYKALLQLDERNELKKHGINVQDIRDMKEMVDEFQIKIKMFTFQPTDMHKDLDRIMEKVSRTHGRGTIKIIGLQESDDGTLVKLEITKE
jgi:hypothetical protein